MEVRRFYRFGANGERCVSAFDFDRVVSERDALQIRLNSVEEENDGLKMAYTGAREELLAWKRQALEAEEKVRVYSERIVKLGVLSMETAVEKRP